MKKILLVSACILAASTLFAGMPIGRIVVGEDVASTSSTPATATSAVTGNGYIDYVVVAYTGVDCDCDVWLIATNDYTGLQRLVYSNGDFNATTVIYPRININTTGGGATDTNVYERIPLYDDTIMMKTANATNFHTIRACVYHESGD